MTDAQISRMIPKSKKNAIREIYQDQDGIWIILNDGWNADGMDFCCRTIHCGGEDESIQSTVADLKYQISMIRRTQCPRN